MIETILAAEPEIRLTAFLGVLVGMALWEIAAPRRRRDFPRVIRWTNNLALVIVDTAILRLTFPILAVGLAAMAEERGWGLFNTLETPVWVAVLASMLLLDPSLTGRIVPRLGHSRRTPRFSLPERLISPTRVVQFECWCMIGLTPIPGDLARSAAPWTYVDAAEPEFITSTDTSSDITVECTAFDASRYDACMFVFSKDADRSNSLQPQFPVRAETTVSSIERCDRWHENPRMSGHLA